MYSNICRFPNLYRKNYIYTEKTPENRINSMLRILWPGVGTQSFDPVRLVIIQKIFLGFSYPLLLLYLDVLPHFLCGTLAVNI